MADNVIHLDTDCPCCILREDILDAMAASGLDLGELLFVLEVAKQDAMELCAANEDDDGESA